MSVSCPRDSSWVQKSLHKESPKVARIKVWPMRILYLIEGDGGGAVTHVLTLAAELIKRHDITSYVGFLLDGPAVKIAGEMGLDYRLIRKRPFFDPTLVWRILRIIKQNGIGIVHTHTIRGNFYGRLAVALCKERRFLVTSVHSHIADELKGKATFGLRDRFLWVRERLTRNRVDHFICVSEKLGKLLLVNGIYPSKITVIENGVELPDLRITGDYNRLVREEFSIQDDEILVATIGRLVPVKNHTLFLKAAREVARIKPNVKFIVVGDGILLNSLRAKVTDWDLDDRVIFAGWRNDVQRLLCATDIYVICSLVEGLNLSVLEAMACGVPVVGTDVKGVSDIVLDHETGILTPSNNVDALASAIVELAGNTVLAKKMGASGRQLIEDRYSVRTMVDNTACIYRELYSTR